MIALLLAAMMMFSLAAACGNDTPAETPTNPAPTTPTTPTPTSPTPTNPVPTKPAKDEKYGGDLIAASTSISNTLDPHHSQGTLGNYQWMQYVYETAIVMGADGQFYPLICDYEYAEDGLTLKLTVRDYYFSNGEKVTIEDIIASYERGARLNASFAEKVMNDVTDIKVEGNSATFTFSKMNVSRLSVLGDHRGAGSYIIPKSIMDKYGDEPITEITDVIGSGPYLLESYSPDTAIKMVRNEDYTPTESGGNGVAAPRMAYCDTITYAMNTDNASRTAAMIAGDYHIGGILTEMQPYAEQVGLKSEWLYNQWTHAIFFNLSEDNADSPVQDVNFRKAFRAALDMNAIMLSVMSGNPNAYELEPSAITSLNTTYYNTIVKDTEWNIADKELAKQYLAQSNYNGEPIVWLCSAGSAFYRAAMAAIPMLEEVGIAVELMAVDSGSHSGLRNTSTSGHDIGAWECQKAIDNPVNQNNFVTGSNAGWWTNDKKTELLDIMRSNPTGSSASVQAYADFCELAADEVPWVVFGTAISKTYTQPNVEMNYEGIHAYYWNTYFTK